MESFFKTVDGIWKGMPSPLAAGIMLALGFLSAILLKFLLAKGLRLVRFDALCERIGLEGFLRKGNVSYSASKLVCAIAYWAVLIATFFAMSRRLDIGVVNSLSDRFMDILPGMLAASFIVVIGVVVVGFVANFTRTIARNASVPNARLLSRAIKWVGNVLVVTIALDQVGFGKTIISSMFQLVFGAIAFGVALAFGLGCKDIAKAAMQRFLANLRENERAGKESDLEG